MTEEKVLKEVLSTLEKLNIPYALTGAMAVNCFGRPRTTHDFDILAVFPPAKELIISFVPLFKKDFYISEEGIIDALFHKTLFNIIHHQSGTKIDFWILHDDSYSQEAFKRRKKEKFLGKNLYVLSPEDLILNKLLWYKESEIDKHINDVKGIIEIQENRLDKIYLKKWAIKLSVWKLLGNLLF